MNKVRTIKVVLLIAVTAAIIGSQYILDLSEYLEPDRIKQWLSDAGPLAPILYMGVMMTAVVISPIPSLPLDIAAGVFFGPILGTLYSVIGALAGAMISFMITRILGRELIERYLGGHINFCTECSDKVLTKIVFISRLIPVVSFDIISYGAGLTKMSLGKFSLATLLGMIPLTFIYNYSGSILAVGNALTYILGLVMVLLFLALPGWLERKGFMKNMKHE